MKGSNSTSGKLKAILSFAFLGLGIMFVVMLFVFKGSMNTFVSDRMRDQAGNDVKESTEAYIDSAYNFTRNGEGFRLTFLEFGATGCSACRMMEKVMEQIKTRYPGEIKVEFINVLLPANHDLMKYYGVAAIPTQVLLNSEGQEVFRHTGYYSFDELTNEFQKINL